MSNNCSLCGLSNDLEPFLVVPRDDEIVICGNCKEAMDEPLKYEKHWLCLHDSMWSEEPAIQVVVFRLLTKLNMQEQLDMLYLEDDILEWAKEGLVEVEATIDSNGVILNIGDSVSIIKDLPVKGAGFTAKQGTTVKNIQLVPNDPTHIQGKVNGTKIFILSKYLKKL